MVVWQAPRTAGFDVTTSDVLAYLVMAATVAFGIYLWVTARAGAPRVSPLRDTRSRLLFSRWLMLTPTRAVVLAAVIVALGLLANTTLPRYEIQPLAGGYFGRLDRWTGRVELGHIRNDPPRAWITKPATITSTAAVR